MKLSLILLFALVNITFAGPIGSSDVEPKIIDFLTQISQQLNDLDLGSGTLQDIALQITQALADFTNSGIVGKRFIEAEQRFLSTFMDLLNQAVKPAVDTSAQGIAALLAQVTAGIAIDGIPAITALLGKRSSDVEPKIVDFLNNLAGALYPIINQQVQDIALQITQALADFSNGGSIGKRSSEAEPKFLNDLLNQLTDALYPIVNQQVQDIALQITQALADFSNGGSIGKRSSDVEPKFLNNLLNQLTDALYPIVNQQVQDIALQITQALADFSNGGSIGKRSSEAEQRFLSTFMDLINQAVKPAVDTSAQGIAALLAQVTAGIAIDGIPAITALLG